MSDHFEDVDFPADSLDVGDVDDFLFLEDFDGNILLGLFVNGQLNLAKSSLTQSLFYVSTNQY